MRPWQKPFLQKQTVRAHMKRAHRLDRLGSIRAMCHKKQLSMRSLSSDRITAVFLSSSIVTSRSSKGIHLQSACIKHISAHAGDVPQYRSSDRISAAVLLFGIVTLRECTRSPWPCFVHSADSARPSGDEHSSPWPKGNEHSSAHRQLPFDTFAWPSLRVTPACCVST